MAEVVIRAMEPSDVDVILAWENDVETWKDGSVNYKPLSKADIQRFVDNSGLDIYQERQMRLMIDEAKTRKTVGCVDLFDFDPFSLHANIGILIDKRYRRNGYALSAIRWIVDYAFDVLGVRALCATMVSSNEISRQLFEKSGFEFVGTRHDWIRVGNEMADELIFEKLNPTKRG